MVTADRLSENSRQGFDAQKTSCIGPEARLSENMRWGSGHIYDETPVDIAVYVRNDPVNLVDPDGRSVFSFLAGLFGRFFPDEYEPDHPGPADLPGPFPGGGEPLRPIADPGGTPESPILKSDYEQKVDAAVASLQNILGSARGLSPSCQEFFNKMPGGLTPQWMLSTLGKATITDPTNVTALVTDYISKSTAQAQGILGWSVARLFREGMPGESEKIVGWSPQNSNVIFISLGYLNPETVAHEALHKYSYMGDEQIKALLGKSNVPGSAIITSEFKKACIDKKSFGRGVF